MQDNEELLDIVLRLIDTGREDDWWDFKECHHADKASLLHDIICMANSRGRHDGLIIFGIRDKTMEVLGCENDQNRRNQQNIVELLRAAKFAGQVRPRVEVRTVIIQDHEIDVFVVKNTSDTPYFLTEDYTDKRFTKENETGKAGKTVHKGYIYCRVMDNNTPINDSADLNDIESLWKKRFGLLQPPLEQASILLDKPESWIEEEDVYYHKEFPQFTIKVIWDADIDESHRDESPEFYHYVQYDHKAFYGMIRIFHYGTQLFSCQAVRLDEFRLCAPCPEREYLCSDVDSEIMIPYRFYMDGSLTYKLLNFFTYHYDEQVGKEATPTRRKHLEVVLIFNDKCDKAKFDEYILSNMETYNEMLSKSTVPLILHSSPQMAKSITNDIRSAKVLKQMQSEFRTQQI